MTGDRTSFRAPWATSVRVVSLAGTLLLGGITSLQATGVPALRARREDRSLVFGLLIPTLSLATLLGAAPPAERPTVEALDWLAGCWASEGEERGSGESWTPPAGGTMLGVSRTVREGRTRSHEFVLIRETEAGGLDYVAHPSGQEPATFGLVRLGEREAVFENPGHDFPQRIVYRLDDAGVLRARIEGTVDGEARAVDFPMRRVACDPSPAP